LERVLLRTPATISKQPRGQEQKSAGPTKNRLVAEGSCAIPHVATSKRPYTNNGGEEEFPSKTSSSQEVLEKTPRRREESRHRRQASDAAREAGEGASKYLMRAKNTPHSPKARSPSNHSKKKAGQRRKNITYARVSHRRTITRGDEVPSGGRRRHRSRLLVLNGNGSKVGR